VLHRPIVQALYERGMFEAQDTAMTASVLLCYILGLVPQSITFITVRLFLARKEAHLILLIVVIGGIAHVLFDLAAVGRLRQAGIALAMSLNATVMATASLWLARRKLGPLGGRMILVSFAKIGLAAFGMGIALWGLWIWHPIPNPLAMLVLLVAVGLAVFALLAFAVRLSELRILLDTIQTRLDQVKVE
jgi:putative peptidoglycan lipid II flippase